MAGDNSTETSQEDSGLKLRFSFHVRLIGAGGN